MMSCDFILPEPASYVFFYAFSFLRSLLYIVVFSDNAKKIAAELDFKSLKQGEPQVP
jgi:hypothetical protein